jgi:hypothetical protein
MFTSLGLFKDIPCPLGSDCVLVNCIFHHQTTNNSANSEPTYEVSVVAERLSPPPQKKRRIENEVELERQAHTSQFENGGDRWPSGKVQREEVRTESESRSKPLKRPSTEATRLDEKVSWSKESKGAPTSASARKSVSPPPIRKAGLPVSAKVKESLNPRTIPNPPRKHAERKALLIALHAAMTNLNDHAINKQLALSNDELISMANEEEERMALISRDEDSYRTITGQRVLKMRKMDFSGWKELVLEYWKGTQAKQTKAKEIRLDQPRIEMNERPSGDLKKADKAQSAFSTTLTSQQEIALLQYLRTPVEGIVDYVTTPPSEVEIADAKRALEMSGGQEVCDRCRSRFRIFPGRNEEGKLTSGGQCHYHWAKLPKFAADARYECCGNGAGSKPCTEVQSHVFKVTDRKRLASILQFEKTPKQNKRPLTPAISIDCEMGYTTLGMEMIRLSALSWPHGEELIDVLVRPVGEVLDLNTRFSGVSLDQFNRAIPFGTTSEEHGDSTSEDGELESELMKVGSPAAARKLLFDKIGHDTALIGHAIDNDLNVLRIIHPFIVDTVLLYPHPRGLPVRYGLKMLTNKYLHRDIQDQHTGHDSKEDAKATGELVRLKVAEKWRRIRSEGWKFEKGVLIPPEELDFPAKPPSEPEAMSPSALKN